ncbi:hypothetical protein HYT01_03655 [Candidatus Giovannonibacteria bacterium]|nr:hypothetical protein [Candidatus Giovannonibacteria bacterium]
MEEDIKKIIEEAKKIALLPEEKKRMRTELSLFIERNPVRNPGEARLISHVRSLFLPGTLMANLQTMAIALIIALLIGGGTSFAAQSALPGDILYPIKVNVNEEVRGWTALTAEAQTEWDVQRIERRLSEAEELSAEGKLNAETRSEIETQFEKHAEKFKKHSSKIESKKNASAALEAHSEFEGSLRAHETVLERLAEKDGPDTDAILAKVRARLSIASKNRANAEAEITSEGHGNFKEAANGKMKAAEKKLTEAKNFVENSKDSVSANVSADAEAKLKLSQEAFADGKAKLEAGSYGEAFSTFQESMRLAQQAKLTFVAEKDLKEHEDSDTEEENDDDNATSTDKSSDIKIESETEVETHGGLEGSGKVKIDLGL